MARKVGTQWSRIPKETNKALSKTGNMTTAQAYAYLKRVNAPKVQTVSQVKSLAKKKAVQNKVSIIVTKNFKVKNSDRGQYKTEDGIAIGFPRPQVRIHPIVKYYTPKHTTNIIDHELDHIRIMRKQRGKKK